jgi:hypothetical protein
MLNKWDSFIITKRKKRNCCILFFILGIIFSNIVLKIISFFPF